MLIINGQIVGLSGDVICSHWIAYTATRTQTGFRDVTLNKPVSYTHLDVYKRQGFEVAGAASGLGGWTDGSC